MNSLVPKRFVSVENHARSSFVGRRSDGPDPVLPIVARHEVTARVADDGGAEFAGEVHDVAAKPLVVGRGMTRLEDAAVDATPEMLDEGAEDAAVEIGQNEIAVDR